MKERFLEIFDKYIKREGAKELRDYVLQTDFFTAPASTIYHGNYEGGLCEHSLAVFDELKRLLKVYPEIKTNAESCAIISLFHDLCKVGVYKTEMRNAKNETTGQWEKVPFYKFNEDFCFGNHGGKSVFLLSKFIQLTDEEAVAIQNHMGNEDGRYSCSNAYKQFPLAWLLHVADESATYLLDK